MPQTTPLSDEQKARIWELGRDPARSNSAIAREVGCRETAARKWRKVKPGEPADIGERVAHDRTVERLSVKAKEADRKYQHLMRELERAEERLNVALAISQHHQPARIQSNPSRKGGEAVAIMLASDWHVGERVDPATINGLNEYSPETASRRAANFFCNGLKLIEKERKDVAIDTLVLWLGGDIITGYIHDELEEGNYLSPTEECLLAQDLIEGGLDLLLKEGGFRRIVVPCNFGNHGRTTKKKRVSTGYRNSFEWLLYNSIAKHYRSESRVEFQVANGYFNYVEAFRYTLRFHHGDNIGYGGGVGGVTIPLNKYIARANQQRHADHDLIGHFHQLTQHNNFTINGSLIGFNAYAQSFGASPERPQQAFRLLDRDRGFTVSAPVFCDDEKDVGFSLRRAA